MNSIIIHLSDLHYRLNWEEDQELVLDLFFKDLRKQLQVENSHNIYLVFSGDVVLAGGKENLYTSFLTQFDAELNKLNIPFNRRFCIPGNHDVSVDYVKENEIEHEAVVANELNESDYNNYIDKNPKLFIDKFTNYIQFEKEFANGIANNILSGVGSEINSNIGIYCLNSAVFSSGGHKNINDKGRLNIDTRDLRKWLLKCNAQIKILVMHHPIDWLTEWSQVELKKIIRNSFSLCLSGHQHNQSLFYSINKDLSLIECSAPPLLTNKKDNLGYAIISMSNTDVLNIKYRQWTRNNSFVTGVNFSDTDDGIVVFKEQIANLNVTNLTEQLLTKRLEDSLRAFAGQPRIWVSPILSTKSEFSKSDDENSNQILISEIIANPKSLIIKAPPQFGLTSLAHFLIKEAYSKLSNNWVYLDCENAKPQNAENILKKELAFLKIQMANVKCIIIDSISTFNSDSLKIIKTISEKYKDIPLVLMNTVDESKFLDDNTEDVKIERQFDLIYLLGLTRGTIRKMVADYNSSRFIAEENLILNKLLNDLEVLNLHRTPLNCLILLKVSEKYFDESPVNRTKMLEMVLFLLFNVDDIPTYKSKPDLKDCEYVLGRFCEKIIRTKKNSFSREEFLKELKKFCEEKLIDLEVDVVFDVLKANNIIINKEVDFGFKSAYWIYYFVAQRMHQNKDFAEYIFEDKRYVSYPEVIEFYTGIDRRREDALNILFDDIKNICDIVNAKVGLPDGMSPLGIAKWNPTPESIEKIQNEIGQNVLNSGLPEAVKDKFADANYDKIRPYDQTIKTIFSEYSLTMLLQSIKASSRALRNSDYVNPDIKRKLLKEILRGWEQISKVLMALTPILAAEGNAIFEGINFNLIGNFGETIEQRMNHIIMVNPMNINLMFKNDLFSEKIGPLLYDQLSTETNDLKKHCLVLLIISERPREWKKHIEDYIVSISKNSFYLYDVIRALRMQYRYSFATNSTLREMGYLLKMGLAKHEFGDRKPGLNKIVKISNKRLPKRLSDEDLS